MIRLLHTSDWHIGRTLYGRKRYEEHALFLDWLVDTLAREQVDVLLVAGDVFDTVAPTNRAQELYYRFLHRAAASGCRHLVVTGGNHDSPSLLDAPKALLSALDIHVVGAATETAAGEVLVLRNAAGSPELILCAVPFLRERDLRFAEAGESPDDKERKLTDGIRRHYAEVTEAALEMRRRCLGETGAPARLPIVGMGHLFAAGGQVAENDGVRELYVGSLARFPAGLFPDCFDYLALGHLHVPQQIHGAVPARYSGSPLPMGFGEAEQAKRVLLVAIDEDDVRIEPLAIPVFQTLERVQGDWETISARLSGLAATHPDAWLEVAYTGDAVLGDLRERLESLVAGTGLELLRIRNERLADRTLQSFREGETLDDLTDADVFHRCMDANGVPETQRADLELAYREITASILETDRLAE